MTGGWIVADRTDYERYVMDSTWRDFDHGPGKFDEEGFEKFKLERAAYFAADKHDEPNILRVWAHALHCCMDDRQRRTESHMNLILLVLILLVVFGGGGFYYGGPYVGGGFGTILLIILIVLVLRG